MLNNVHKHLTIRQELKSVQYFMISPKPFDNHQNVCHDSFPFHKTFAMTVSVPISYLYNSLTLKKPITLLIFYIYHSICYSGFHVREKSHRFQSLKNITCIQSNKKLFLHPFYVRYIVCCN